MGPPRREETAIVETFGWLPVRHYQVLNALLDRPEAPAYAPLVVRRLQRLMDGRRASRQAVAR